MMDGSVLKDGQLIVVCIEGCDRLFKFLAAFMTEALDKISDRLETARGIKFLLISFLAFFCTKSDANEKISGHGDFKN